MADMLVKLYDVHFEDPIFAQLETQGIFIKQAIAPEKRAVATWVDQYFGTHWASETECAFSNVLPSCFIAVKEGEILGFACVESTYKCFFGPTGVREDQRGQGIGKALLLRALAHLSHLGYAYAIIGSAGPGKFYEKVCGATAIPGSVPGVYRNMV